MALFLNQMWTKTNLLLEIKKMKPAEVHGARSSSFNERITIRNASNLGGPRYRLGGGAKHSPQPNMQIFAYRIKIQYYAKKQAWSTFSHSQTCQKAKTPTHAPKLEPGRRTNPPTHGVASIPKTEFSCRLFSFLQSPGGDCGIAPIPKTQRVQAKIGFSGPADAPTHPPME